MKKVVDKELRDKMKEAVSLLCSTVKITLGPKGNNVIIDHSDYSPFITNDGVTIAENICSDDEVINTILELAKEATVKTNDEVGDGTTTTLVLLESIFNEGMKLIEDGLNPIMLKKKLDHSVLEIVDMIKSRSRKPTKRELLSIACTSSNDKEIGKIVYEVFMKVKDKNFINLVEGDETKINYIKGYVIDTVLASNYFIENELYYEKPYILLSDSVMYDLDDDILNKIYNQNSSLVVIAPDYDDNFVNEMLSLVINNNYKIVLLKTPLYGNRASNILKDLSCISLGKINHESYSIDSLGFLKSIKITKEKTMLDFLNNDRVRDRIIELKSISKKEKDSYEKDFYDMRIAMLKNKIVEIYVGAPTKVERREKLMRFEDSLCSVSSSYNGVVTGSGIVFYEISEKLDDDNIFKKVLKRPLEQIIKNAGLDLSIISKIKESDFKLIYNVSTDIYEDINDTSIIDSESVVINSLINATSIAGMLLTTSSLVINEYKKVNELVNYDNL